MTRTQLKIEPGLVLDARRALWLAAQRTLVVSDLHLGYAWTHRESGQLLPIGPPEDTLARLADLVAAYEPSELVLLGDILHGGCEVRAVREALRELTDSIGARTRLRLVEGNHDFTLARLLQRNATALAIERQLWCGSHLLMHGHLFDGEEPADLLGAVRRQGGRAILGHEHPALRLSDGVASSALCPCFAVGPEVLILPSFSPWSAGGDIRSGLLSPLAKLAGLDRAVVIIAGRLLSVALDRA